MGVLIPLLLIVAICLLLAGLALGNQALVVACFVISALTFVLMRRARESLADRTASRLQQELQAELNIDDLAADLEGPMTPEPAARSWPTTEPVVRAEARIDPETLGRSGPETSDSTTTPEAASAEAHAVVAESVESDVEADERIRAQDDAIAAAAAESRKSVLPVDVSSQSADLTTTGPVPVEEPETVMTDVVQAETTEPNAERAAPSAAEAATLAPVDAAATAAMPEQDSWEPDPEDEPSMAYTVPPLVSHGGASVWVVDGRPRYHVRDCGFLADLGETLLPIPLLQAVEDGFTPCSICNPDISLVTPTG